jgi:hypothetical protein
MMSVTKNEITSAKWTAFGVILASVIAAGATLTAGYLQYGQKNEPTVKEFKGRVSDSKNGKAIRRVKVSLEGPGAPPIIYSDSEGFFIFPLEKQNTQVRVRVQVNNYEEYDRFISTASNTGVEEIQLNPVQDQPLTQLSSPTGVQSIPKVFETTEAQPPTQSASPTSIATPLSSPLLVKSSPSSEPYQSPILAAQFPSPGVLLAKDDDANINIRVGAGKSFRNVHYGLAGDKVSVLNSMQSSDGDVWYQIKFNTSGADGWVHQDFVKFN